MQIAAVVGSLKRILEEEVRAGERAVTRAVREETDRTQHELRAQTASAFGPRGRGLAGAWRARVFPRTGESLGAAGIVWTKAPTIIDAFERGATIRAKAGRYLAIPTGFNAPQGRRGRGMRVTPQQMVASGQAFLRPMKQRPGGFVWCLPVRRGERVGRRRAPLIAGGIAAVATARIAGAAQWQADLLRQGFVPMFLLLPEARLVKRLNLADAAQRAQYRLRQRIIAHYRAGATRR
ncbi:DUF6441 family protein [Elioraea sp.]|uniref:DUF6441 family protein n=1 Tax=Elioraea sp. TaxID=2185103 RepID=UPI003F72FAD3